MRVTNELIWTAQSTAANVSSAWFSVNQVYGWAATFIFTGTPSGALTVNYSCAPGSIAPYDQNPTAISITDATLLASSSISVSASGNQGYNQNGAFYNWVQFVWTGSGTGTVTGRLNLKGV